MNYVKSTWMSLSRAFFFDTAGTMYTLARSHTHTGPVCRDGATAATTSFYFSFSSIYSYPAEQMYLTFFHLPFDHFSFGVIIPLSFILYFFYVCIHFKQFLWRVSYMHDAVCFFSLLLLLFGSSFGSCERHEPASEGRKAYGGGEKWIGNWKTKQHLKITLLLRSACDVKIWSRAEKKG